MHSSRRILCTQRCCVQQENTHTHKMPLLFRTGRAWRLSDVWQIGIMQFWCRSDTIFVLFRQQRFMVWGEQIAWRTPAIATFLVYSKLCSGRSRWDALQLYWWNECCWNAFTSSIFPAEMIYSMNKISHSALFFFFFNSFYRSSSGNIDRIGRQMCSIVYTIWISWACISAGAGGAAIAHRILEFSG